MPPSGPPPDAAAVPAARAWLDFERPAAEVRALLFDLDLAVRGKIHRGVRLQWSARRAEGERRLRQTTRVLDRMQVEEGVVEEGPSGEWVKRFVDGPNEGARFVARVEDEGTGKSRVHVEAFVGPRGFAQGLGKLSPLGLEKSLRRLLGEYKRALVGYEPGRARGAVMATLAGARQWAAPMHGLAGEELRAVVATLLETAWSIAAVDDPPDEMERDAMQAIVAVLWNTAIKDDAEERMVRAAVDAVSREGAEARCDKLGARLQKLGVAELGLRLAVLVAEVSHGLAPAELGALRRLAAAAGVNDAALGALVSEIDDALSGGNPLSRMSTFV